MDGYVFSMMTLSIFSTAVWWILVNILYNFFYEILLIKREYINSMFLYLLFYPCVSLFQNAERYKYKLTVLTSMFVSIGASLLSVILVYFERDKLSGRILGYILPTVFVGVIVGCYFLVKIKRPKLEYWKYALPIVLPYIPHLLSMSILSNMDRVMIRKICGAESVALYSLAYICGMIMTMLVGSVNSAYAPWLADKLDDHEYTTIQNISFPYVASFSYLAVGCVLVAPEILYILGGDDYLEAIYVIPPVAAGCLMQFIYCMYVNVEQYAKRTVGMAIASIFAAAVNYILNWFFIPILGYIAAAYTTFAGYFILLILHMLLVRRAGYEKIYKNTLIFICAITTAIIIISISIILKLRGVRYMILAFYMMAGIKIVGKYRYLLGKLRKG